MSNRSLFTVNTVEIDVDRFDTLIRTEEKLNIIKRVMKTDGLISCQILYAILACEEDDNE